MAISQFNSGNTGTGYLFPVFHSTSVPGARELSLHVRQFAGISGESHQVSGPHGRDIQVEVDLTGYSIEADLYADLEVIAGKVNVLFGQLTIGNAVYADCTFKGLTITRKPFADPHQGWTAFGTLNWRQR